MNERIESLNLNENKHSSPVVIDVTTAEKLTSEELQVLESSLQRKMGLNQLILKPHVDVNILSDMLLMLNHCELDNIKSNRTVIIQVTTHESLTNAEYSFLEAKLKKQFSMNKIVISQRQDASLDKGIWLLDCQVLSETSEQNKESSTVLNDTSLIKVITAIPLNEQQLETITQKLKKRFKQSDIRISTVVDPSILAGMIIESHDELIDQSLKSSLTLLKKNLLS